MQKFAMNVKNRQRAYNTQDIMHNFKLSKTLKINDTHVYTTFLKTKLLEENCQYKL